MKFTKILGVLAIAILATGCANQSAQNYYQAMSAAATANAVQQEARYRALATVAANGSESVAASATMAIAMTRESVVVPQYIESEALSYTRVLAAPVAAVAGLYIQADVAKNASNNNRLVQLGQQSAQQQTILGLSNNYTTSAIAGSQATAASVATIGELSLAGLDALNVAGAQTVTVAGQGFASTVDVASQSYQTIEQISSQGIITAENLGGIIADQGIEFITEYSNIVDSYNLLIPNLLPPAITP